MYIGGTDETALHHLAAEILDNAMDEAVAGHASFIEVTLEPDNWLTVRDNGRGIPVDPHPKFKNLSALEVILTTLHSGGKFGGKAYATSGGLHGVGSSVVNALSEAMEVEVARDRVLWKQSYARGKPTTKLINAGPVHNRRGTSIRFKPDPTVFGSRRVQPGAAVPAVPLQGLPVPRRRDPLGLRSGAAARRQGRHAGRGGAALPGRPARQPGGRYRRAGAWCCRRSGRARPTCPAGDRPGRMGGVLAGGGRGLPPLLLQHRPHAAGRHARGRVPRRAAEGPARLGRAARQPARGADDAPRTCSDPIAAKLSVFLREPQFQGQTKEKLTSGEATRLVETALRDRFDHWLAGDPTQADNLLAFVIERAEERLRRRESKDTARKSRHAAAAAAGQAHRLHAGERRRDRDLPGRGRQRRRLGQAGAQPRDPGGAAAARQDPERRQRLGRQAAAEPGAEGPDRGAGLRRRRPLRPRASCATAASSS